MSSLFSMWRPLAAACVFLFLCGCSYLDLFENPEGVVSPPPATIRDYVVQTESETEIAGLGRRITAGEYLVASLSYTNESCHGFFDTLERFKDDNSLLNKVLDAAAAAGTPLLGFTEGSKAAVKFATAITFGKQVNTSLGDIYAYVAHRDQLKRHVLEAMADYRRLNGLSALTHGLVGVNEFGPTTRPELSNIIYRSRDCENDNSMEYKTYRRATDGRPNDEVKYQVNACKVNEFLRSHEAIDLMVARNIAADYASLCSLSNLKTIISEALAKTKSGVAAPDSAAPKVVGQDTSKN